MTTSTNTATNIATGTPHLNTTTDTTVKSKTIMAQSINTNVNTKQAKNGITTSNNASAIATTAVAAAANFISTALTTSKNVANNDITTITHNNKTYTKLTSSTITTTNQPQRTFIPDYIDKEANNNTDNFDYVMSPSF